MHSSKQLPPEFPTLEALFGEGRGGLQWKRPHGGSPTRSQVTRFTWVGGRGHVLGRESRDMKHLDPCGQGEQGFGTPGPLWGRGQALTCPPPLQKAKPQLGCSEGLKGQLWYVAA